MRPAFSLLFMLMLAGAAPVAAQTAVPSPTPTPTPPAYSELVQVTATRVPEAVKDVPASLQVVSGDELRDRGATDLKSALALIPGVDVASGGDAGPAASVPELWGLREFDAFVLVVDGVPWGGAFNPALGSLDLSNVERIEVQHGPAPVMFGATSFVGVIHVRRREPSEQQGRLELSGGSYSSGGGSFAAPLPAWGGLESALSADFHHTGFRDDRSSIDRGHALWRGRHSTANGSLSVDLDATWLRQDPASPSPREGRALSSLVPLDANHNPNGAALDENRYFANAGYDRLVSFGAWSTTVAFTHSSGRQLRGFLGELSGGDRVDAAGFDADIEQNDLYVDSHLAWNTAGRWRLVAGVDLLHGKAAADGDTFDYEVGLDGSDPGAPIYRANRRLEDRRNFFGSYANLEWTPAADWRVDLGMRLNRTGEERGEGEEADAGAGDEEKRDVTRLSGGVGVGWTAWRRNDDELRVFANWKNAFKPAAIDFNLGEDPAAEGEGGILEPETSNSYEAGLRSELLHHALHLELSGFLMDLDNLVVAQSVGGLPALANAGTVRLRGLELAAVWHRASPLFVRASYSLHDARFRDYLTEFDGVPTQLQGNRLEMSPHHLAALGVSWAPDRGVFASAELSYVGSRYLDKRNRALAAQYATLGAGIGWRSDRWEIRITGRNLTDRRDPVSESELGDAQYYRLFPRRIEATAGVRF